MGARLRAKDWAATSLGSLETWPQATKTAAQVQKAKDQTRQIQEQDRKALSIAEKRKILEGKK